MTGTEQFISSLVHSLAWPVAAVSLAALFRTQLSALLSRPLHRLRIGPFEIELERVRSSLAVDLETSPEKHLAREDLRQQRFNVWTPGKDASGTVATELVDLAQEAPAAAILDAFARVERRLQQMLEGTIKFPSALGANALAASAMSQGLISPASLSAVEGLAVLRNLAAHDPAGVSSKQAVEYLTLVDGVQYSLQRQSRPES
jgi:hypothetical protein